MHKERLRRKWWSNKLLIGNSKWKQMTLEEKKLISWWLVPNWKEKSSLWIKDKKWRKISSKNRFMLNSGCLMDKRNSPESKKKLRRKRSRLQRQWIFFRGNTMLRIRSLKHHKPREKLSKQCSRNNGQLKLNLIKRPIDKNSSWIVRETLN